MGDEMSEFKRRREVARKIEEQTKVRVEGLHPNCYGAYMVEQRVVHSSAQARKLAKQIRIFLDEEA